MSEKRAVASQIEPRRGRGRPRAEDLAALEAGLVRAARQCFLARGYGATSMNEVARAARVSKGTLYARFPAKADLFRAIIDEQIQSLGRKVHLSGPKPGTLEVMLRLYAQSSLRESLRADIVELNRLIYSEAGRFPELGEAVLDRTRVGVRQVSELIRECAVRESVPCRDPQAAAEAFTTLLRGFYGDALLKGRPLDEEDVKDWTRRAVKVFLGGRREW